MTLERIFALILNKHIFYYRVLLTKESGYEYNKALLFIYQFLNILFSLNKVSNYLIVDRIHYSDSKTLYEKCKINEKMRLKH